MAAALFALLAPRSTSDDEALGWRDAIMGISYTFLNAAELPGKLGYGVKCICKAVSATLLTLYYPLQLSYTYNVLYCILRL